ncbi:MAG TPA: hypothetical protein VF517_17675 [Thermoleophilaceae bacterium]
MIRLTRERTEAAVPKGFRGAGRLELEAELLRRRKEGSKPRSAVWKDAKPQLHDESDGKCGYCEGKASHVAHGDVEHYRPKDVYWWLAYCYDNYIYSCQICNQSYKGINFPAGGTVLTGPAVDPSTSDEEIEALVGTLGPDPLDESSVELHLRASAGEQPGIPDPYALDPEPLFRWNADDVVREVKIEPRDETPAAALAFAAADQYLGLNRDELLRWRYETYDNARLFVDSLPKLEGDLRARTVEKLNRMMSVHGEFAGMVRYFVRDVWQAPL